MGQISQIKGKTLEIIAHTIHGWSTSLPRFDAWTWRSYPQIDIVSNIYNSYLFGDILILRLLLLLYLWTSDSGWYLDSFFPFFCLLFSLEISSLLLNRHADRAGLWHPHLACDHWHFGTKAFWVRSFIFAFDLGHPSHPISSTRLRPLVQQRIPDSERWLKTRNWRKTIWRSS